ncbi:MULTISPECIES: terminase small subunit [Yersinia pseudotuberculosis complex]|uniref:Putative phage terminase, small subunit n=1 Tax=Yersinia pseudotuberculosis serotype O:1b (strain IP 31758) TaxID=349747 RepID=A0A0U1R2J8_YERP3|nr:MULTISPECIES: terminase small subunit [Yersinia pseudotuberculosis complex]ABS49499.1 putative phage terminase, small subunit [Yersinia pseudotuberculosis IP 31758]AJK15470.1 terminase small subunit [Yersinia pseudotuberculosis str. PA3606]MCE4114436.1 terminase small subunit [Yersinia pseudotuberculosis]MCF1164897.1 terminase small subunit [Yersinia pseudotuberculosis]RYC25554.1 terminase small subunit [Yersinia pseudotuberculosis]
MTLTEEQKALFDALTQLQRRFVTALLEGANQTEAYRRAGGKAKGDGERSKANQLVTNSNVQAFLQSVQHETVNEAIMTYTEALERLTLMGRTTIHDIATFGNYQIGEDEEGQPVFQASWKFKDSKNIKPEHLAAVAELSTGKDGLKIKLHDPKAAIKQLAEMCGWEAPKKAELTGPNGGPIQTSNLTPDEAAEAYRKMMG